MATDACGRDTCVGRIPGAVAAPVRGARVTAEVEELVADAVRRYNTREPLRPCRLCHHRLDDPVHYLGCLARPPRDPKESGT